MSANTIREYESRRTLLGAYHDGASILPLHRKGDRHIYPSGSCITDRYGAEIVTRPYEYVDLHRHAKNFARMFGHIPTTPRASIHVHVDVADKHWTYVQNLVRWFIRLEAVLFRLSALGEAHRGTQWFTDPDYSDRGQVQQDHNYARPLTDSIGIRCGPRMIALINTDELLQAKTASTFVAAWGRLDTTWGALQRYCPHRLHALNIVSLQTYCTVEWRLFNGRYKYLPKVLEIINAVHLLAEKPVPDTIAPMPLGSTPDISAQEVSRLLDVDITKVWGNTWVQGCQHHALKSHYRNEDWNVPSSRTSVKAIFNNAGDYDSSTFCFGVSSAPRGLPNGPRIHQTHTTTTALMGEFVQPYLVDFTEERF